MSTRVAVIVPAAGSGSRFGGDIPKQFRQLGGKPLVQIVVERFLLDERVSEVVVPVAEVLLSTISQTIGDRVRFVAGGATRQQSVTAGLRKVSEGIELIAVHDAVRPFFSIDTFHAVLDEAEEHGAAFPGIPVADTIHLVRDGAISETPDRPLLYAAQTPQCFRLDVLRDVLERSSSEDATDEAGLAARLGHHVQYVPGDPMNFKITHAEDFLVAEQMYQRLSGQ